MHPQSITTPKRLAIAARVSTADQERYGTSLDAQVDKGRLFAQLHDHCVVDECIYADDESGSLPPKHRPLLQRMLADARAGRYDAIVWHRIDRVARKLKYMLEVWDAFEEAGITIFIVEPGIDTSDYMGRAIRNILGTLAELERELFLERTTGGRRGAMNNGAVYLPRGKYGYIYHRKDRVKSTEPWIEINPEHERIIERIFTRRIQGAGYERIAMELTADGVLTAGGKHDWRAMEVQRIVQDRAYMGEGKYGTHQAVHTDRGTKVRRLRRDGVKPIDLKYPPIVSEALWLEANTGQRRTTAMRADAGRYALNGGMVTCVEHGHAMSGTSNGRGQRYYACSRRTGCGGRTKHTVPAEELEDAVWDTVVRAMLNPALLKHHIEEARRKAESNMQTAVTRRVQIAAARAECKRRMTWLLENGSKTGAPPDLLAEQMDKVRREDDVLAHEDQQLAAQIALEHEDMPLDLEIEQMAEGFSVWATSADRSNRHELFESLRLNVQMHGFEFTIGGKLGRLGLRGAVGAHSAQSPWGSCAVRAIPFTLSGSLAARV